MIKLKKQLGFTLPLVISIVVVLVIAGGVGYYFYKTSKGPAEEAKRIEKQLEECFEEIYTKPTQDTQEKCQSAQAKFKDFIKDLKDPLICEQFEQAEQFGMRNSCLSSVAKNLKDPSICEKISPKGPEFPGPQSDCYTGVAVALKDYSTCEKIISLASPELTSSCYREVAIALKDPLGCEKIPEVMSVYEISFKERVVWAENYCYKKVAEILGDASMCEKIQNLDSRGRCWLTISEVLKIEDSSVCELIKELSDKRACYENVFNKAENPDFCEKVKDQFFKDKCYARFCSPWSNKDGTLCEKIQDRPTQDYCYTCFIVNQYPREDIGKPDSISKITAFCEKMFSFSQRGRDICYVNMIYYGWDLNIEYCEKIQARDIKDKCFKQIK